MTDRHPVSLKSGCIILEPYCGPQEAIPLEIRVKQRFLKRETAEIRHPINVWDPERLPVCCPERSLGDERTKHAGAPRYTEVTELILST